MIKFLIFIFLRFRVQLDLLTHLAKFQPVDLAKEESRLKLDRKTLSRNGWTPPRTWNHSQHHKAGWVLDS